MLYPSGDRQSPGRRLRDSRTRGDTGQRDRDRTAHGRWGRGAPLTSGTAAAWAGTPSGWGRAPRASPLRAPSWRAGQMGHLPGPGRERSLTLRTRVGPLRAGPRLHWPQGPWRPGLRGESHPQDHRAGSGPRLRPSGRGSTPLQPHGPQGRTGRGTAWGADRRARGRQTLARVQVRPVVPDHHFPVGQHGHSGPVNHRCRHIWRALPPTPPHPHPRRGGCVVVRTSPWARRPGGAQR